MENEKINNQENVSEELPFDVEEAKPSNMPMDIPTEGTSENLALGYVVIVGAAYLVGAVVQYGVHKIKKYRDRKRANDTVTESAEN